MPKIEAHLVDNLNARFSAGARDRIREGTRQAVLQGAQELEGRVKTWIADNGPYDRGRLRQSIHSTLLPVQIAAKVSSNVNYAAAAHSGRKPGKAPPPSVLIGWVRRRVRQGRLELEGIEKGKRGVVKARERQIKSIAFLIGRKIARVGTKGVPFFDIVYDESRLDVTRSVESKIVTLIGKELSNG